MAAAQRVSTNEAEPVGMNSRSLWMITILSMGGAFLLYVYSAAPGLTWAHFGADGGELLAAAITNGVPHSPGYPLYILLLQPWLQVGVGMGFEPARLGNIFSAFWAALSVGMTVLAAASLTEQHRHDGRQNNDRQDNQQYRQQSRWFIAGLAGLFWAVTPLLWSQAVITEVYALHIFLVSVFGWLLIVQPHDPRQKMRHSFWLLVPIALGVANHMTFLLLLPAALYSLWVQTPTWKGVLQGSGLLLTGVVLGGLFYLRIPLVAGSANGPPPVNWGYADNWVGFRWLVSGAVYQDYQFGLPAGSLLARFAAWARTFSTQYTPIGLAIGLLGLSHWDRNHPYLRNLSLLWIVPISIYAIFYNTWDSNIYLLPVIWLCALWLAVGFDLMLQWLQGRLGRRWGGNAIAMLFCGAAFAAVCGLAILRYPDVSLRRDSGAQDFLASVEETIAADSIVVTGADAETFALWYAVWGTGDLIAAAPRTVLVAYPLYQFEWYRRLLGDLYPEVTGIDVSLDALIAANGGERSIYFTEPPVGLAEANLHVTGPLWRYVGRYGE